MEIFSKSVGFFSNFGLLTYFVFFCVCVVTGVVIIVLDIGYVNLHSGVHRKACKEVNSGRTCPSALA